MAPFWKKNELAIPAVPPTQGQVSRANDPYASRQAARRDPYASAGGDPYGNQASPYGAPPASSGGYSNNMPGPGAASRGDGDAMRNELFSGYKAPAAVPKEREYGYEGRELEDDFNEDDEIEGIKQSMRQTKQDSLASTRNTLRMARQAEEQARATMGRLADQSEHLANTERNLDMAKANSQRADDETEELRKLNRSIFRPTIVWNKEGKRLAQEKKVLDRHNMERDDRMKAMMDVQESRRNLGGAANTGPMGNQIVAGKQAARREARKKFQFDATASDDELEDELDENLDETLEIAKNLNRFAGAMGKEVDKQNTRISNITDKTDRLNIRVQMNTTRLSNIK